MVGVSNLHLVLRMAKATIPALRDSEISAQQLLLRLAGITPANAVWQTTSTFDGGYGAVQDNKWNLLTMSHLAHSQNLKGVLSWAFPEVAGTCTRRKKLPTSFKITSCPTWRTARSCCGL